MERSRGGYNTAFQGRYLNSGWSHVGYGGRNRRTIDILHPHERALRFGKDHAGRLWQQP